MVNEKKNYKAWLYLAPLLFLMVIFTIYPLIKTILISFDPNYNPIEGVVNFKNFGFDNYRHILVGKYDNGVYIGRGGFDNALVNTLLIVVISVPLSTILALAIAVGLMSIEKVRGFFQTIYFLPYITNTIAIGMVFAVLFNYQFGLVNAFFGLFGMDPINWVNQAGGPVPNPPSKTSMMIVAQSYIVWQALPFKILIFVGGIQGINKQYYQAAQIDNTSKWRVFRKITVPMLSPLIMYVVITSLIGSFKTYSAIIGLFPPNSEQVDQMNTLVGYVYSQLGKTGGYSLGAAGAVVLFLIILVITGINSYIGRKKVHY